MLTAQWQRILSRPDPQLSILATIDLAGGDPAASEHLALNSGVYRFATQVSHVPVDGYADIPFAPYLLNWPLIDRAISPEDRRAEISEVALAIGGDSGFAEAILDAGTAERATVRLDLWAPGIDLRDVIPLLAGRVSTKPKPARRGDPVALRVVDGDPDREYSWPSAGVVDSAEFPDVPAFVAGAWERRPILGPFPFQVLCPQIDRLGQEFYLCDGVLSADPTSLLVNGLDSTIAFSVVRAQTMTTGATYTKLVLASPAYDVATASVTPAVVSCAGGVGLSGTHPILLLLDLAGFSVSTSARSLLGATPFGMSVLPQRSGDVLEIVRDLCAQTDLIFGFLRGQAHVWRLGSPSAEHALAIGANLMWRLAQQEDGPGLGSVFNRFEVRAGRNEYGVAFGGSGFLYHSELNASRGGDLRTQRLLSQSEKRFGPRPLTIDAPELATQIDATGLPRSAAADRLAATYAYAHAVPWERHSYKTDWLTGLGVDLMHGARLTDADEELSDAKGVITRIRLPATGPEITVAVRDAT